MVRTATLPPAVTVEPSLSQKANQPNQPPVVVPVHDGGLVNKITASTATAMATVIVEPTPCAAVGSSPTSFPAPACTADTHPQKKARIDDVPEPTTETAGAPAVGILSPVVPTSPALTGSTQPSSWTVQVQVVGTVGAGKLTLTLPRESATTVAELKAMIAAERPGLPVARQLLICAGRRLDDGRTLAECRVVSGQALFVGVNNAATASPPAAAHATTAAGDTPASVVPASAPTSSPPASSAVQGTAAGKDVMIAAVFAALATIKRQVISCPWLYRQEPNLLLTATLGCRSVDNTRFITAGQTLLRVLGNALDFPLDPKFRRIRMGNEALRARLLEHPGGTDALRSASVPAAPSQSLMA